MSGNTSLPSKPERRDTGYDRRDTNESIAVDTKLSESTEKFVDITDEPADIAEEPVAAVDESEESTRESVDEPSAKSDEMVALTMEEVKKTWPRILQTIKSKKISVASYLLEGELMKVRPGEGVTGSTITLGFAKRFNFHKEALEHVNNKKFVEKIASDVFGQIIELELVILEESRMPSGEREDASAQNEEEELEHEAKKNAFDEPIIQSAVEIFNGKIIKGQGEHPGR